MTAALEGGEWSAARPGRTLPSVKTRHPFYRRLGGPQGWSERTENLIPTGFSFIDYFVILCTYIYCHLLPSFLHLTSLQSGTNVRIVYLLLFYYEWMEFGLAYGCRPPWPWPWSCLLGSWLMISQKRAFPSSVASSVIITHGAFARCCLLSYLVLFSLWEKK